jgi:preprotein translocase subunit SecG
MLSALLMTLLFLTSVFLILLVLIQRGRGGGLAGAFGGLGGQSAFGTKAGDLFTRITIGVAAFWIVLCALSVKLLSEEDSGRLDVSHGQKAAATTDALPGAAGGGKSAPAETGSAAGKPAAKSDAAASTPAAESPSGAPSERAPAEDAKSEAAK